MFLIFRLLLVLLVLCVAACAAPKGGQRSEADREPDPKEAARTVEQTPEPNPLPGKTEDGAAGKAGSDPVEMKGEAMAIRENLEAFLAGKVDGGTLKVAYDDLHGLHGGIRLSVDGNGAIVQETRPPGGSSAKTPKAMVSKEDFRTLVQLLLELEAWEQQIPERPLLADESLAKLKIETAAGTSSIWEHYNDLKKVQRIVKVRDLLFKIAWKS